MCTLCLSDMGELRDEWLREPRPAIAIAPAATTPRIPETAVSAGAVRLPAAFTPDFEAAAA